MQTLTSDPHPIRHKLGGHVLYSIIMLAIFLIIVYLYNLGK
ncbi:MAG: hypothetical protein WCT08_03755 [Patescibacteria group bacterium]|jgi:hypothetical protein